MIELPRINKMQAWLKLLRILITQLRQLLIKITINLNFMYFRDLINYNVVKIKINSRKGQEYATQIRSVSGIFS